jgi:S-adenosylmethionine:tRNA ribosyltransferase-isomerase
VKTDISLFDYELPRSLIAQSPAIPRESANLMCLNKNSGIIKHHQVADFPKFLNKGDILVVNNTRVFRARLFGTIQNSYGKTSKVELFLVRPLSDKIWLALGKPGKKILPGEYIYISENFIAEVLQKNQDGTLNVNFNLTADEVISQAEIYGHIPVPPYIKKEPLSQEYQTSYAKISGSVAAPTAGFHLTPALLKRIKDKGVEILEITLHVGLGTFLPVKTENLEDHQMHSEWAQISKEVAIKINQAKENSQRIIAVGTTTVRTLEGVAYLNQGKLTPFQGDVNLFIKPGFKFNIIDGMLTNFHLPKSTLLVLISTFTGREKILNAYNEAIKNNYRFYSFGDAMYII